MYFLLAESLIIDLYMITCACHATIVAHWLTAVIAEFHGLMGASFSAIRIHGVERKK